MSGIAVRSKLLGTIGRHWCGAKARFVARCEERARAETALRQLNTFSERELHDLGLNRCDLSRIAGEMKSDRRAPTASTKAIVGDAVSMAGSASACAR